MAKYQYDTGKEILTGANNIIRFVIKEWAKEGKREFTTKEVDERLNNLIKIIPVKIYTACVLIPILLNTTQIANLTFSIW